MAWGTFGRTNRAFPPVWLRLGLPRTNIELDPLIEAASEAATPIDISSQPGLWGGRLRGKDRFLTYVGSSHFEHATDDSHAANLVQADLIQTLSAIGRETLDIYFLRIRRAVEEFQISGVLEALESAKQEGHVQYIGLCCDGNPFAALSMWQFHDAFDVVLAPTRALDFDALDTLAPLARERRLGVVATDSLDWLGDEPFRSSSGLAETYLSRMCNHYPIQVTVRSADEVRTAMSIEPADLPLEEIGLDLTEAVLKAEEAHR